MKQTRWFARSWLFFGYLFLAVYIQYQPCYLCSTTKHISFVYRRIFTHPHILAMAVF